MPNIKSAIKRVKVSETKNLQKFESEVAENPANAATMYGVTTSAIDKAVTKGVIHKNAANRKKARLAKRLAKAQ